MKTRFSTDPHFYVSDIVYATHPMTGEKQLGEIDYISKREGELKPYLVCFDDCHDQYYSYEELEKTPLSTQVGVLREKLLDARNHAALSDAGYDCLLWDSNILEDAALGLIKQYRLGNDLTKAFTILENALGGKENVSEILESVYKDMDYNFVH